jgi:nucleoside-diphosphate kinase
MERTLVLIKPDAVRADYWLEIIKIYEQHGLIIRKTKMFSPLPECAVKELYREHEGKDFYDGLVAFMQSGTTIALIIGDLNAVALVRAINGATKPENAVLGTIRFQYGTRGGGPKNAVHGSASSADAEREIALIFGE